MARPSSSRAVTCSGPAGVASSIRATVTSGPSSSTSTAVTRAPAARSSRSVSSSELGLGGRREPVAVRAEQPDRQVPAARVVGEHDDVGRETVRHRAGRDAALDARGADGGHVRPLGYEVGAVFGEVGAQPEPGLVQAGPRRAGRLRDLAGGHVGVVVQGDGAPLPGGQAGHRRAQRVGPVQVLGRGQAAGRRRVQRLGPVGQQRDRGAAVQAAADVEHDAGQPAGEPVRIPQPVQGQERLQERFLHDVVHVAGIGAQLPGPGADHRPGAARPAGGTPPGHRRGPAGPGRRRRVSALTAGGSAPGSARRSSGFRSAIRPEPVSAMPNRIRSASAGIRAVISYLVQGRRPEMVRPWSSRGPPHAPPVPDDLQAEPGLLGEGIGADLAAEGDGGAAVIVGVDGLEQGGGPGGPRDVGGQDRGRAVGGGRVVRLSVRGPAGSGRSGSGRPGRPGPSRSQRSRPVGEVQVARLVAGPRAGQRGHRPARQPVAGPGPGVRRHAVEERGEQVIARHRDGQPVQHRVGQPDRGARGGGQGQAQAEVGGDLPGSGRAGQPDPRHGDLRAQLGGAGFGQVDVHPGHPGAGRARAAGW